MNHSNLELDYLRPLGSVGLPILIIGLIFTTLTFYFVFFRLNGQIPSLEEEIRKQEENDERQRKINRLYPKNKI